MIGQSNQPIWKRALMRAGGVALILLVGVELLRLAGRGAELSRIEEAVLVLAGGGVYGGLWAATAAMTKNMLKKIEDAAKGEKK